jgi:hypothetical protein
MYAIATGALRTKIWRPVAEHFFNEGFRHLDTDPVLAGKFVILDVRDVSPSNMYGYYWQLHATIAIATHAFGPYESSEDHTDGVAALATWAMPWTSSMAAVRDQARDLLSWAINKNPQTDIPHEIRARHQMAQAEYYRAKAEGARQGVADRLWRERHLDHSSADTRAEMAAWVHEFGDRPMVLHGEDSAHNAALFRRDFLGRD